MKYLILDKEQRTSYSKKYTTAVRRIIEELEKKEIEYDFAYNSQVEFIIENNEFTVLANGRDITEYSHILFRGHHLHIPQQYHMKRMVVDAVDYHNKKNNTDIKVQNAQTIKQLPYYNKMYIGMFFAQLNLPYFPSYYRMDGNYKANREHLTRYPMIIKSYQGVNDLRKIDGKRKIKKNVYKLSKVEDLDQEWLKEKDKKNFFLQEMSETAIDFRTFVSKGKLVGGWKRESTDDGFMTVGGGRKYSMYNNPPKEVVTIAEKAANALKADFLAVDFMYLKKEPYIQEISLNPGFKAYETKIEGEPINVAKAIVESF